MLPFSLLLAAGALLALWLAVRLVRETGARSRRRAGYLADVVRHFPGCEMRIQPTGFPRLTLPYRGLSFDVQVVPDSLTFRKLPALWVMLTLPEPLPGLGTLDLMARPSGNEPFSRFPTLSHFLPPFPGLPADVALRCDDAGLVPPSELLQRHGNLFADPAAKELVISPRGLRIVILAEEADRGRYLIFRDAEMGHRPLPADRVAPLLDRLLALRHDILAAEGPSA